MERALLNAIVAAPDDDAPREVYADYLDDVGRAPEADRIRAQLAIARMPEGTLDTGLMARSLDGLSGSLDHWAETFTELLLECSLTVAYERGFPSRLRIRNAHDGSHLRRSWAESLRLIRQLAPTIRYVTLSLYAATTESVEALVETWGDELEGLGVVTYGSWAAEGMHDGFWEMARPPQLRELTVADWAMEAGQGESLARWIGHANHLERLSLPPGIAGAAASRFAQLPSLKSLICPATEIAAWRRSAPAVQDLHLDGDAEPDAVRALAGWPLVRLTVNSDVRFDELDRMETLRELRLMGPVETLPGLARSASLTALSLGRVQGIADLSGLSVSRLELAGSDGLLPHDLEEFTAGSIWDDNRPLARRLAEMLGPSLRRLAIDISDVPWDALARSIGALDALAVVNHEGVIRCLSAAPQLRRLRAPWIPRSDETHAALEWVDIDTAGRTQWSKVSERLPGLRLVRGAVSATDAKLLRDRGIVVHRWGSQDGIEVTLRRPTTELARAWGSD